jgi:hypothetical protein
MRFNHYLKEAHFDIAEPYRYYAEIRVFDEHGDDYVNDITRGHTAKSALRDARRYAKTHIEELGKRIKINVFDTRDPKHGTWCIHSETKIYNKRNEIQ